jgi:hypothetical protein
MILGRDGAIQSARGNVMSINRREALAAAVGCGLTTAAAAGADDKPPAARERPDPVLSNVPVAIRPVFEKTFPNHRCVRMAMRPVKGKDKDKYTYRGTFFDPASTTVRTKGIGEEIVTQPLLYDLEVSEEGKVIEETPRPVLEPARLPKAVVAAYEKWNPKGIKGMAVMWTTEVPRGKDRVYGAYILVNAIKSYSASFKEDGSVIAADPAVVP